jgi:hypothetical protein
LCAVLVGGALFGTSTQAQAGFSLTLTSNTGTITVNDGDANDSAPAAGVIVYQGLVGNMNVAVTTGSSNAGFNGLTPALGITNLTTSGAKNDNLTLTLTDTGFTAATSPSSATVTSQLSTTQIPNGSVNVSYQSIVDGQATQIISLNGVGGTVTSNPALNGVVVSGTPYTITSVTKIHFNSAANLFQATGNTTLDLPQGGPLPTPAPAGLVLALSGAPFFLAFSRLRRRLQA